MGRFSMGRMVGQMNEQIRKLLDKATYDVLGVKQVDQKQFAELIVRECMACSTWVGKVNTNSCEPIHTAEAINQRIKKHFGVEE